MNLNALRSDQPGRPLRRPMEGCAVRLPKLLALTVALAMNFASAGLAQDAPADGQQPPPMPDKGTTPQSNCISQKSQYTQEGKAVFYVQTFENKCEARLRCKVFAYLVNARGPTQGRSTLTLGPKSAGAAATKAWTLKVKGAGGSAMLARECLAI